MAANSFAWYTSKSADQASYHAANIAEAEKLRALGVTVTYDNDSWRSASGQAMYFLDQDEIKNRIIDQMKVNSAAWHTASATQQKELSAWNEELGARLRSLGVNAVINNGVWMVGNKKLFDLPKFHEGGIVGKSSSLRDEEILALLKTDEAVLTKPQKENAFEHIEFSTHIAKMLGNPNIDLTPLTNGNQFAQFVQDSMLKPTSPDIPKSAIVNNNDYGTVIENVTVSTPIQVLKELGEKDIMRLKGTIGNVVMGVINDRSSKSGRKSTYHGPRIMGMA